MSRAIDILLGEILEAIELVQRYTEGLYSSLAKKA
jgi:hypothetical protein